MISRTPRFLWLRLIACLLICVGIGTRRGEASAQEKSFLWQAKGEKNVVYILGSIHLLKRGDAELKPIFLEVFEKSSRLVFEIDLVNEGQEKLQKLLLEKGVNLDGKLLPQQISPETYELAERRASAMGVDLKLLAPLKPWMVALTLVVMQLQSLGYDGNLGIDHQLAQRAKAAGKPVAGLETAEFQIDIFNRLTASQQEMFLRQSLLEMDLLEKTVDDMVRAWRAGDLGASEKLFLESMRAYPQLQDKVLDDRNRRWMPQIEQMLKQDQNFLVVVGAGHLVGKTGVIELLKARGYNLEQM